MTTHSTTTGQDAEATAAAQVTEGMLQEQALELEAQTEEAQALVPGLGNTIHFFVRVGPSSTP